MKPLIPFLILFSTLASPSMSAPVEDFLSVAKSLENPSIRYDSGYRQIDYPMGDVPAEVGVCSDVIIRAYRGVEIDLQKRVHEDMRANFGAYPKLWGLSSTDKNIDHRRVPNLRRFFERQGAELKITENPEDYQPGDIVSWNLVQSGSLPHIGIVLDKRSSDGARPLIMHNIGGGQVIEDMLFDYEITGHYRYEIDG